MSARHRACRPSEHEAIKRDPMRWRSEMTDHQLWPGVGEMANHSCNSTLIREYDKENAR